MCFDPEFREFPDDLPFAFGLEDQEAKVVVRVKLSGVADREGRVTLTRATAASGADILDSLADGERLSLRKIAEAKLAKGRESFRRRRGARWANS